MMLGIAYLTSCTSKYEDTYEPYNPPTLTEENVGLEYDPAVLETYPVENILKSDTPTVATQEVHIFGIDTALHTATTEDTPGFVYSKLKIDKNTGVISYDNTSGKLLPGTLTVDVTVAGIQNYVTIKKAFTFEIKDVPINVTADPSEVETSALYVGVISNLSYEIIGNPEQPITSVSYSISPSDPGFTVNNAGEISKNVNASAGVHKLSILATTNLGTKLFKDLVTVNVTGAPVLIYNKHDGSGELTKVTLAPGSAYSTTQPELSNMEAQSWEILVADDVPQVVKDALSVDENGIISVAADPSIPEGDVSVGVTVTSVSGVPVDFPDKFVLSFQNQWNQITYKNEDLDPDLGNIEYGYDPGSDAHFSYGTDNNGNHIIKGYHGTDKILNSWFIAKLPMDNTWTGTLSISFKERNGWGAGQDVCYSEFVRTLDYSYDQTSWTNIMPADDPDWPTSGSGSFNNVVNQSVNGLDNTNSEVYVKWHYDNSASDTKTKSVWMFNDLVFKYSIAYDPIEE